MILTALLLAAAPADPCAWGMPTSPRRMTGVFVNEFEAQRFYENRNVDAVARHMPFASLNRDGAKQPSSIGPWLPGHVYRLVFTGIERAAPAAMHDVDRPCAPTSGEMSRIKVLEIIAADDLGTAADLLAIGAAVDR